MAADVLNILYSFPHRLGRSGIGTTAWYQVAGLAERGHRVSVYCGSCERAVPEGVHVVETMRFGRWRLPYRAIGVERAWSWHDRQVARVVARSRPGRYDLVHTWPSGAIHTLEAARDAGVRSFLERPNAHTAYAYDIVEREMHKLGLRAPRGQCHRYNAARLRGEQREFEAADCLLCPSDFVARTFTDRGVARERIGRHQYGYDPARFTPSQRQAADSSGQLNVLFAGTCEPRKGLHLALEAWFDSGAHEHGTLYIAGRYAPGYRQLLASKLAHPSIRECGFSRDMASLMRRCDVLILPSLEEGSALVSYEARACGCVLLVSDATGAIARHGHDALVHLAGDAAALSRHLAQVATDRALLVDLRRASLADVDRLTWSSAARRLDGVYRQVLAERPEAVACPA